MKRLFLLLASLPIGAYAFEFKVTIVWKNLGGDNPVFSAAKLALDGSVVGSYSQNSDFKTTRAATWSDGNIKTFEGLGSSSFAQATNSSKTIAGGANLPGTELFVAGYWNVDGQFRSLGVGPNSAAKAIASNGSILGEVTAPLPRSFVWHEGNRKDLPVFDKRNESHSIDINDSEVAVGYDFLPEGGGSRPWMWDAANGLQQIPVIPYAINDFGVVAGTRYVWDNNYAFAYENGVMRQLEGGSTAYAVNNELLFVGVNFFSEGVLWRGYRDAESLTDLIDRSLGLKIGRAFDVNDAGQILAYAVSLDGKQAYTVRLDPVPEPASMLALLGGLGGLMLRRRNLSRAKAH